MIQWQNSLPRFLASIAGLVALGVMIGLYSSGERPVYVELLSFLGIIPFQFPFLDTDGTLAAWECARKGADVIISDPCDILKRGYTYGPFWMTIDWIPLGRADRVAAGIVLDVVFLLSLSALPPSIGRAETVLRVLAVFSTMVVFALERANPDLVIFVLVVIALNLLRRSFLMRLVAYGVAFLAGALKYYPFILLGLIVRERAWVFSVCLVLSILGLLGFFCIYEAQIIEGIPHIPIGQPFGDMFGAKNVLMGTFYIVARINGLSADAANSALATTGLLIAVCLSMMIVLLRRSAISAALRRLDEPRRLALLAGALLVSGCFFSSQNVGYRGVFLLLTLPGLFALGRDEAAGPVARVAAIGVVPLMWAEAIRGWVHVAITGEQPPPGFVSVLEQPMDFIAWCLREAAWWGLVAFLLTLVVAFLYDNALFRLHATTRRPFIRPPPS